MKGHARAWTPVAPSAPPPPKTAPCGRSGLLVAPNGVAPLGDALNALGCGAEPKGDVVAGAPNADGEVAGAPNGDAGAAPKAPTGFPNAFEVPPKPPTPPPPNPPAKAISSQQTSASQLFGSCEGKRRCITRHERVIKRPRHLSRIILILIRRYYTGMNAWSTK